MKNKIIFTSTMLLFAWVISVILFFLAHYANNETITIQDFMLTIYVLGPVAGCGLLAIIVSEISDHKRRKKEHETEYAEKNE